MAFDDIPRTHAFSLGDFHDFDHCVFRFFVNHHLQKKYELAEGTANQVVGSLLDLAIKKLHQVKAYGQPVEYLPNLIRAAEREIKEDVAKRGTNSFYGAQLPFLSEETVTKAQQIFKSYYLGLGGKVKRMVATPTTKKVKPFWEYVMVSAEPLKLWGAADSIEMGENNIPEVVDYKYFDKGDESTEFLDMDLMPKLYTLLCAKELVDLEHKTARFYVRLWHDPGNNSYYEEFDLAIMPNIEAFFKDKMERILRTRELSFCEKEFCKACNSPHREEWVSQLKTQGWIEG